MRYSATHFEQVPIEIVEIVLRHDATLGKNLEKSRVSISGPEEQATAELSNPEEIAPSKGQQ